jgi:hypothetical protein
MVHSTLNERLRIYVSTVTRCLVGLILMFITGVLIALINTRVGIGLFMLSLLFFFGFFHWNIAKSLIPKSRKPVIYALPVIIFSILLLTYKVAVNVTLNVSCLDKVPERTMLLNYIGYSMWTGILLWEIYLTLFQKQSLISR